jgi:hypothetical protein
MLGWLRKLIAPRRPVDVQYEHRAEDVPSVIPAAPPTTPYPPAAPIDSPARDDESGS